MGILYCGAPGLLGSIPHCAAPQLGIAFGVKVLLRNPSVGLYYAGRKHWVDKAAAAADLMTIERATELSADENFEHMEILVDYDDPSCALVLPLTPRRTQRKAA